MRVIKANGRNRLKILEDAWPVLQAEKAKEQADVVHHLRLKSTRKPPFEQQLEVYIRQNDMYYCHIIAGEDPNIEDAIVFMSFAALHNNYEFRLPSTDTEWFETAPKSRVDIATLPVVTNLRVTDP